MDPETAATLSAPGAWDLLQSLPEYDEGAALAVGTRLRAAGHDPALVAAVLTQSRLRLRGRVKFGDRVERMLLTQDGVEQATRWQLAARHAARFAEAGLETVWDLGCGLGGDALALAAAGLRVEAVDADPTTAALAAHNLDGVAGARVRRALIEELDLGHDPGVGAWLDPARRLPGRTDARGRTARTFSLDQLSPTWDQVQRVAATVQHAGAKLAPSFPHHEIPGGAEAQWASFGGEALECVLWWGDLVRHAGRTAQVHVGTTEGGQWHEVTDDGCGPAPVASGPDDIGEWLHEPDRAVLQAGLIGVLARLASGTETAPGVGYVTGPAPVDVPWARPFRVRSVHSLSTKALRRWAHEEDIGALTIKKRSMPIDPDRLRHDLRLRGTREAVVVLTPVARQPMLLEVSPVAQRQPR
ncbi:class I SAM-dependent methyltransferase [Ornithinimicrobium sp. F0845]|uniref:THUMP-like domain-containing protein n=1 Tax=Ornithinimicrobium sp. F0845 TaxID=2926412 RepID=UPI001FF6582E|nr:class I SAM-dependent methyltransferase [Ornithinimicrobium sp. F0845]MCK0111134.1 class I SAM-dependent methyltransferase [Ornithinimicrobium sp. F0845]